MTEDMSKLFVTHDSTYEGDPVSFDMIEDEDGATFWGYGHRDQLSFLGEVNRWLRHCGVDADELVGDVDAGSVTHHHALLADDSDERFSIFDNDQDGHSFPVTRLVL